MITIWKYKRLFSSIGLKYFNGGLIYDGSTTGTLFHFFLSGVLWRAELMRNGNPSNSIYADLHILSVHRTMVRSTI
jgi:hypothetical protein